MKMKVRLRVREMNYECEVDVPEDIIEDFKLALKNLESRARSINAPIDEILQRLLVETAYNIAMANIMLKMGGKLYEKGFEDNYKSGKGEVETEFEGKKGGFKDHRRG